MKIIALALFFMLTLSGLGVVAGPAGIQQSLKVESKTQPELWLQVEWEILRPGLIVRIGNDGTEAFDGNISGNVTINAKFLKYGNLTSFGPKNYHIERRKNVIVNHTKFLGFGIAEFNITCGPPVDITIKFRTFIFLYWIWSFVYWKDLT